MIIGKSNDILSSEITSESIYVNRRQLLAASTAALGLSAIPSLTQAATSSTSWLTTKISQPWKTTITTDESVTPWEDATQYNNFYEFGFGKSDPAKYADRLKTEPWSIEISGEVSKPGTLHLEDLVAPNQLEERIYRFRCVEAWSMVVPWLGFSLADLLKRFEPTADARFVQFETLFDPKQFPAQKSSSFPWPYMEGLRIDEAMNPLAFMAVGMYGKVLPNQNGAPIRLVVPWKYGFKSIKSIVKIRLVKEMPKTTWNMLQASEYGFYANVNPEVDHPRWSQKTERRLPSSLFTPNRIPTLKFNGYEEQVAYLYKDMDLRKFY
ncbi:protein-methionine-sulfoxide reductase catalytic subunit MsrP [Gynuella sunshinyii]|uniref:Protein-methionine-sulfoxide reductase catalytic subunit MsrP n=1 Tax=Gynuella sunshinyii YC6258 TaxID=1445510 RepID=A0A0C5VVQ8_9GAMM|nr:protein-methionine-sulfoxide reductase catalytic subunit MsrP [Gynuella sunshinyii]AJQ97393.1 sulfite oxidase-related enzyme [Gynuella sunshinyii YC6258]